MLSTLKKRIIFIGNFRWWYPNWRYLDDASNDNWESRVFLGESYMERNIFDNKISSRNSAKIATNRMKLNRVIDSSEYVVRCEFGKTANPTSGFEYKQHPAPSYGTKTDILSFWYSFFRRGKHNDLFSVFDKDSIGIHNHFNDLTIRFGIDSPYLKHQNQRPDFTEDELEEFFDEVLKSYGSKMIPTQYTEQDKKESWIWMSPYYSLILNNKFPSNFMSRFLDPLRTMIDRTECNHGLNVKYLSLLDYGKMCEEIRGFSISYNSLVEMIGDKKWSEPIFRYYDNAPESWMKTENERSDWMDWVKDNNSTNRGFESIWTIFNDSRFKDYEKYVIGVMGINECFKIDRFCPFNEFGEYFWLSNRIKSGELKFLPEHIDELFYDYTDVTLSKGMNIHCEK